MIPSLEGILCHFDRDNVDFAMGYGSGIMPQIGYDNREKMPMLDFIFTTNDPIKWHQKNYQMNPHHYSNFMRFCIRNAGVGIGTGIGTDANLVHSDLKRELIHSLPFVSLFSSVSIERILTLFLKWIQNWGAHIYYNNNVRIDGYNVKYGIISTEELKKDLLEWKTLYVAGRMHKPHLILKDNYEIKIAQKINLDYAFNVARSLLPAKFTIKKLLEMIIGISFMGDFRMKYGENPRKIENILHGQYGELISIYRERIEKNLKRAGNGKIGINGINGKIGINYHSNASLTAHNSSFTFDLDRKDGNRHDNLELKMEMEQDKNEPLSIPTRLREKMTRQRENDSLLLENEIKNIIGPASWKQAVKGIMTAGPLKSISYGMAKVVKKFK